jgi:acetate kinase
MNVLTLNAGSTSVKFALFEDGGVEPIREGEISWADGNRDHAGMVVRSRAGQPEFATVSVKNDSAAAACALEAAAGVRPARAAVEAVGHRVVHGGTLFRESIRIDEKVKEAIARMSNLAPLHNPPALSAIEAAENAFPGAPQVAVFDTAFYEDLPPKAFLYPVPYSYYERFGIRRFGFHGISHSYCARRAAELLKHHPSQPAVITCHLGGGCSATATRAGRAVATTSGFSALDGLMMGTRSGSLDPGILLALEQRHGLTPEQLARDLNSESGLFGVSGISADLADIERAANRGVLRAVLAFEMFADRVRAAIGGLAVTLGNLDALVFTDRMGENSAALRANVCDGLELLGVRLDRDLNEDPHPDADIAAADSRVRVFVIHTKEELMIAREAARVVALD